MSHAGDTAMPLVEQTSPYQATVGTYRRFKGAFPSSEEDEELAQQFQYDTGVAVGSAILTLGPNALGSQGLPRLKRKSKKATPATIAEEAAPTGGQAAKIQLQPNEARLAIVYDGKVMHQTSDLLLSHTEFVARTVGELPVGARVVTVIKDNKGTGVHVVDSRGIHGAARPAPQVVIEASLEVFE